MPYGADNSSQAWRLQSTPRGTADLSCDREWFAEALMVERIHGDTAFVFIAERISLLAKVGDFASVERWMAIADRLDRLQTRGIPSGRTMRTPAPAVGGRTGTLVESLLRRPF